ncbi:glycoside hydrolase family 3 N-terminal domain-containing protein [Paenarthrobacter ureafaciens]|uniref:glycoside hydrolase family 3 N-terminal domain-containing protein n=1 Tax=Paenarthrobacter ureafaciens TaxID=37931 RepID=UPI003B838056
MPAFEQTVEKRLPPQSCARTTRSTGVRMSENRWLLTDVLRGEWGFDGYAVSDWGAVTDPVAAIEAGLDLEMRAQAALAPLKLPPPSLPADWTRLFLTRQSPGS